MKLKAEATSGGGSGGAGLTFYTIFFGIISNFIIHGLRFFLNNK